MFKKKAILIKAFFLGLILILLIISFKNYSNISDINKEVFVNKININNDIDVEKAFNKTIIYISRHDGTVANFKTVGELLNFNVTTLTPTVYIKTLQKAEIIKI